MQGLFKAGFVLLACTLSSIEIAAAQPANQGCVTENSPGMTQTLRCELGGKALLIEVAPKPGGNKFQVVTPQAIAAVRGTKWAVDAAGDKTSVFVINGRVGVGRRTGGRGVTLGPGEGVDVEPGAPLTVKRWAPARVSALLARLGQ
jgi:hypothetical protein